MASALTLLLNGEKVSENDFAVMEDAVQADKTGIPLQIPSEVPRIKPSSIPSQLPTVMPSLVPSPVRETQTIISHYLSHVICNNTHEMGWC